MNEKEIIEKFMKDMFGEGAYKLMELSLPSPRGERTPQEFRRSENPKIREVHRLLGEVAMDDMTDTEKIPEWDLEARLMLLSIGMAMMVVQNKGAHANCLQEVYLAFTEHVMGRQWLDQAREEEKARQDLQGVFRKLEEVLGGKGDALHPGKEGP